MSGPMDQGPFGRRELLRWIAAGSAVFVSGCGEGGSSGSASAAVDVVTGSASSRRVPAPAPTPTPTPAATGFTMPFRSGVSFSTIEGAADSLPGHLNGEVFVTPTSHFAYYASKGLDHIRLEASWERMQPRLNGRLGEQLFNHYDDPDNPLRNPVSLVKHYLDEAQANGLKVILDLCHNYGERWVGYDGSWGRKWKAQLGSDAVPISAFVDYCVKQVEAFGDHPAVVAIELMNEPHDLEIGENGWREACQQAITAIRRIDSKIAIVIDGYGWASAEYWGQRNPTLHRLSDPADRIIWSAHQYFDSSSAGIYNGGSERAHWDAKLGVKRLAPFIEWLKTHGFEDRGHVGEFGAPDRGEWQAILREFVASARAADLALTGHQDVAYLNDPYTMNLFPTTDSKGVITGEDRYVVRLLQS